VKSGVRAGVALGDATEVIDVGESASHGQCRQPSVRQNWHIDGRIANLEGKLTRAAKQNPHCILDCDNLIGIVCWKKHKRTIVRQFDLFPFK
jgi:hypothetical protein